MDGGLFKIDLDFENVLNKIFHRCLVKKLHAYNIRVKIG